MPISLDKTITLKVSCEFCQSSSTFKDNTLEYLHVQARRAGWSLFGDTGYAVCPNCNKLYKKLTGVNVDAAKAVIRLVTETYNAELCICGCLRESHHDDYKCHTCSCQKYEAI